VAPVDHDRLDRGLVTLPQQPREADRSALIDRDPRENTLRVRQVRVKASTRIITTDRGIVIDLAAMLLERRNIVSYATAAPSVVWAPAPSPVRAPRCTSPDARLPSWSGGGGDL
jgi:hypothetical protein